MIKSGKKEIEAPISLTGLFQDSDSEIDNEYQETYEVQKIEIIDTFLDIRQYSWHQANANKVWPGTFVLADYINNNIEKYKCGKILELGAATGALSIYLRLPPRNLTVITSDIKDEGEVENNIKYNCILNNISPPNNLSEELSSSSSTSTSTSFSTTSSTTVHIPYTWGDPWPENTLDPKEIQFIIASDILLYVKFYPQLVSTLSFFFDSGSASEFAMSWLRRISESHIFFDLMDKAGFSCVHQGQCLYTFTKKQ